jgi:hypothetical protein
MSENMITVEELERGQDNLDKMKARVKGLVGMLVGLITLEERFSLMSQGRLFSEKDALGFQWSILFEGSRRVDILVELESPISLVYSHRQQDQYFPSHSGIAAAYEQRGRFLQWMQELLPNLKPGLLPWKEAAERTDVC